MKVNSEVLVNRKKIGRGWISSIKGIKFNRRRLEANNDYGTE